MNSSELPERGYFRSQKTRLGSYSIVEKVGDSVPLSTIHSIYHIYYDVVTHPRTTRNIYGSSWESPALQDAEHLNDSKTLCLRKVHWSTTDIYEFQSMKQESYCWWLKSGESLEVGSFSKWFTGVNACQVVHPCKHRCTTEKLSYAIPVSVTLTRIKSFMQK